MLVLLPVAHHLVVLITSFLGIGKWESFNVVVLQDRLGYLGLLNFHMKFRINLAVSAKKPVGIFIGTVLNL